MNVKHNENSTVIYFGRDSSTVSVKGIHQASELAQYVPPAGSHSRVAKAVENLNAAGFVASRNK